MIPVLLLYIAVLGAAWGLSRWLERRDARRRYAEGRRMVKASRPGPRPDTMRITGDTDEEIVGYLVDGHFERRGEW